MSNNKNTLDQDDLVPDAIKTNLKLNNRDDPDDTVSDGTKLLLGLKKMTDPNDTGTLNFMLNAASWGCFWYSRKHWNKFEPFGEKKLMKVLKSL